MYLTFNYVWWNIAENAGHICKCGRLYVEGGPYADWSANELNIRFDVIGSFTDMDIYKWIYRLRNTSYVCLSLDV